MTGVGKSKNNKKGRKKKKNTVKKKKVFKENNIKKKKGEVNWKALLSVCQTAAADKVHSCRGNSGP